MTFSSGIRACAAITRLGRPDVGSLAVMLLLAGCQPQGGPPSLTLEEAKDVTASFEAPSFIPPPKTIDDVTAILVREKPDERAIAQARAVLDAPIPDATDDTLAEFYLERGRKAEEIGDHHRATAELQKALAYARSADLRSWVFFDLAANAGQLGKYRDATQLLEEAISASLGFSRGRAAFWASILASMRVKAGDLAGGERTLDRARQLGLGLNSLNARLGVEMAEGYLLHARGNFQEADAKTRAVLDSLQQLNLAEHRRANFSNRLKAQDAINLIALDRHTEAEVVIREALADTLRRTGKYSGAGAILISRFALIIAAQGRFAEAERLAREVLDIYRTLGAGDGALGILDARRQIADALAAQGRWDDAQAEFETIARVSGGETAIFDQSLAYSSNRVLAAHFTGHAADALAVARQLVQRDVESKGPNHYDTAESRGVLAIALAGNGQRDEALAAFRTAIPILLQRSRRSSNEATSRAARDRRLRLILEGYMAVLAERPDAAAVAEAFRIAGAARGQSLQRALSASAARAAAKDAELADLARREQDAVWQIGALNGLYANAASAPEAQQDAASLHDLRTRIDRLRGARAALMEEIELRFPDYAALSNPRLATMQAVRAALRPGEALIATYVSHDRSFVWAVPKTGQPMFASPTLGRARLAAAVADLRRALDPKAVRLGDIPEFDLRLSYRVFDALLAPVKEGWQGAESLLVVSHGPLGQLPFSVLVTAPAELPPERAPLFSNYRAISFLARLHAVTVLPSVASLLTLRRLAPAQPGRRSFAGFGDPVFAPGQAAVEAPTPTPGALAARGLIAVRGLPVSLRAAPKLDGVSSADLAKLPRLPDTADEIRSIAVALKADLSKDVFVGAAASEGRVKTMTLSGYKVLAFATHGLLPGDLDGLRQPALALSSPRAVGGDEDGLLTMGEILGLKLNADWVVLSACNTAAGAGAGAEAVSGLGRAFFYAGTRALLVSNWPVETTSARALTTDLFARQAADSSLERAGALRRAMLGLIDGKGMVRPDGRTIFSYAHPIFWAPFSLIGDGGAPIPAG